MHVYVFHRCYGCCVCKDTTQSNEQNNLKCMQILYKFRKISFKDKTTKENDLWRNFVVQMEEKSDREPSWRLLRYNMV